MQLWGFESVKIVKQLPQLLQVTSSGPVRVRSLTEGTTIEQYNDTYRRTHDAQNNLINDDARRTWETYQREHTVVDEMNYSHFGTGNHNLSGQELYGILGNARHANSDYSNVVGVWYRDFGGDGYAGRSQIDNILSRTSGTAEPSRPSEPQAPERPEGARPGDTANAANNNRPSTGQVVAGVLGGFFGGLAEVAAGALGLCATVAAANAGATARMNQTAQQCLAMVTGAFMNGQSQAQQASALASAIEGRSAHEAHAAAMMAMSSVHLLNRSPGALLAGMNAECANSGGFAVSSRSGTVCA